LRPGPGPDCGRGRRSGLDSLGSRPGHPARVRGHGVAVRTGNQGSRSGLVVRAGGQGSRSGLVVRAGGQGSRSGPVVRARGQGWAVRTWRGVGGRRA
jgi:hypothetical protein